MSVPRDNPDDKHTNIGAGLRVLVVDDNKVNCLLMQKVLEHAGFDVTSANSAGETMRLLPQGFDVFLLDVEMPIIDGLKLCYWIRQEPTTSKVPVIFLSARQDARTIEDGLKAGACDFLHKPFDHHKLVDVVHKHGSKYRQSMMAKADETSQA